MSGLGEDRALRRVGVLLVIAGVSLLLAACAPGPRFGALPPVPDHAVTFDVGYNQAFDRIVRTLREAGYHMAIADHRSGVIETRPRPLSDQASTGGPFEYQTFFSIRVRGGWSSSWALVNLLVLPTYPEERERMIEKLKERLR